MTRPVNPSPARKDDALDTVLAKAPVPALPPGLAARIVASATQFPQHAPSPPADSRVRDDAIAPSADVVALVQSAPEQAKPRRRLFALAGFATLAASVAAALVFGASVNNAATPMTPAAAPVMARAPTPATVNHITERPVRIVQSVPPAVHTTTIAAPPVPPATAPETPAIVTPEAQLATSASPPAAPVAGPVESPPADMPRGLMGPPAPAQGWAFGGGTPGSIVIPGAQSPGQSTGAMPPPPASGGGGPRSGGPSAGGSAGGSGGPGGHH